MKMYDCDICLSAGSVTQWGYCEICGEDFEDPGSFVEAAGYSSFVTKSEAHDVLTQQTTKLVSVGQDAA